MRCSSCIGSNRPSQPSKRRESTSQTADINQDPAMDDSGSKRHPSYRTDTGTTNISCKNEANTFGSDDHRPPSIVIEELDEEFVEEPNLGVQQETMLRYEEFQTAGAVNLSVSAYSTRVPLEVIHEEELSDSSDSEVLVHAQLMDTEISSSRENKLTSWDVSDGTSCESRHIVSHKSTKSNAESGNEQYSQYPRRARRQRCAISSKLHQKEYQVPTTCLLVDAIERDIAPMEYRSICITQTVNSEALEAEVINISSNSSSIDNLSDLDNEGYEQNPENSIEENNTIQKCSTFEIQGDWSIQELVNPLGSDHEHHLLQNLEALDVSNKSNLSSSPRSYALENRPLADKIPSRRVYSKKNICNSCADLHHLFEDNEKPISPQTSKPIFDCRKNQALSETGSLQQEDCKQNVVSTPAQPEIIEKNRSSDFGQEDGASCSSGSVCGVSSQQLENHEIERTNHNDVDTENAEKVWQKESIESGENRSTPEHSIRSMFGRSSEVVIIDRVSASAVVGNHEDDTKDLKEPSPSTTDRDCRVNHCDRIEETPPKHEETMSLEEEICAATVIHRGNRSILLPPPIAPSSQLASKPKILLPSPQVDSGSTVTNLGQHPADEPETDRLPLAQLVPLTVEALSSATPGSLAFSKNAEAHSGDHTGQTHHADDDQASAKDSVDAVASLKLQERQIEHTTDDQSVLLKYIQETSVESPITVPGENIENGLKSTKVSHHTPCLYNTRPRAGKNDLELKIARERDGDGIQHLSAPSLLQTTYLRNVPFEILPTGTDVGMKDTSRRIHSDVLDVKKEQLSGLERHDIHNNRSTADKAKGTLDVQTEISRLKDAELQEEFRKLELETAKFERELQQITLTTNNSDGSIHKTKCIVSRQNEFVTMPPSVSGVSNITTNGLECNNTADTTLCAKEFSDLKQHIEKQEIMDCNTGRDENWSISKRRTDAQENVHNSNVKLPEQYIPKPPPPPPPPLPSTNGFGVSSSLDEENVTKKVKDRVRDLMASQAAAAEEARLSAKPNGKSAPSTPTASRKRVEKDFKEFKTIHQRDATPEKKYTSSPDEKNPANEPNSKDEIKVNVAALIATHQEKQHLQTTPSKSSAKIQQNKEVKVNCQDEIPEDPNAANSEPIVSVSDKCQQFEQRIRQNSIGSMSDMMSYRNSTTMPVITQQTGIKTGTNFGRYGDECCGVVEKNFSEADLLHEIDHALVLAKDFLFSRDTGKSLTIGPKFKAKASNLGVWSPHNRSSEVLIKEEHTERSSSKSKAVESNQPAVWTPRSAPPSPSSERREFRSIGFESPKPIRKTLTTSPAPSVKSVEPPWTVPGYNLPVSVSEYSKSNPLQNSASNPTIGTVKFSGTPPPSGQSYQVRFVPHQSSIPKEPTINSLLKSKDGKTATLDCDETAGKLVRQSTLATNSVRSSSCSMAKSRQHNHNNTLSHTAEPSSSNGLNQNQSNTMLDARHSSLDRTMQANAPKVDGIGPTTREGMPLTLRSEIDEKNRDKWYKQMYQTLHKANDDDDYVTIRYKTRKGYPYKSSGYQSEPEPNYDSDHNIKYNTLDRRRTPLGLTSASYNKFNTLQSKNTAAQQYHPQSVKSAHTFYKNQPGRIENYIPGRSSISEKESKEQLEHHKHPTSKTYTEGNLSRALKEQGYESDSTLVFKKREPLVSAALSPVEQKQYYKTMQAGGEIPLQGFRKPAPEKPKDHTGEAIEADLKVEIEENCTENITHVMAAGPKNNPFFSRDEIACYPITNISRPLDMFGSFPKGPRTFVPPVPPSRKSSHTNSTLKIMSQVKTNSYDRRSYFERSTVTDPVGNQQHSKFRSKSAGPSIFGTAISDSSILATSSSTIKEEKNHANSTRATSKRHITASGQTSSSSPSNQQRKSSPSPVAFGRGISKERTFAEEKKRIEEKLPKVVSVSTSILRNPELKSPNEVKKALRSSYLPIVGSVNSLEKSSVKRFSSSGIFHSVSSINSSNKSLNRALSSPARDKRDKKTFKISLSSTKRKDVCHEQAQNKSISRKFTTSRAMVPGLTINGGFQRASKTFGLKTKTLSSNSLARTSSTFSISSNNSKSRPSRIRYIPCHETTTTRHPSKTSQKMFSLDRGVKTLRSKSSSVVQECQNQDIIHQTGIVRTNAFFRNLFLKGAVSSTSTNSDKHPVSVMEKAQLWNNLSSRSEPSLKQSNYYLSQAKPVTSSKFKSMDAQNLQKLSQSQVNRKFGGEVIEQIHRFESLMKLTDNEHEDQHQFGYVRGRRMELDYSIHERSRSEPPAVTTKTTTMASTVIHEEQIGTNSPRTIVGRRCQVAQRASRSPSCRRIQYLKGKEGEVKKIIRARSLSSNNDTRMQQERTKSVLIRSHSLHLNQESGVSRSRFRDLNSFYNSLERLGQLERVTSSSSNDLRPTRRTREEDIIDYDLWKRVRDQEKAERELNQLKTKLKLDQRDKDLFFLPRDPEEVRWRSDLDTGLRNREKSVEDVKCILNQQALSFEDAKLRELEITKDHYKPLWRGSSVIDVASQLEEKYSMSEDKKNEPHSLDIISSNLLSTLSSDQMKKLRSQLSEIYSSGNQKVSTAEAKITSAVHQEEAYIINVPEKANKLETLLKVRSNSVLTKEQINPNHLREPVRKSEIKSKDNNNKALTIDKQMDRNYQSTKEVDLSTLSRTLCQELKDKIIGKHYTLPSIGRKTRNVRPTIISTHESRFLPMESYLKKLVTPNSSDRISSYGVKTQDNQKDPEMTTPRERPHSYCDTESISSETSNKTVIFRKKNAVVSTEDIKSKIKYFEKKQTTDETPTVTIYHAREDSSLSEDELGTQQNYSKQNFKTQGSVAVLSQSFTDLKDLFGEKTTCPAYIYTSGHESKRNLSPKHFTLRSRSSTPDYATCIQTGEVKKIKDKFESLDVNVWRQNEESPACTDRQYQSDSELNHTPFIEQRHDSPNTGGHSKSATETATIVRCHELGDVSRITHKYEVQSERARCRKSRKERVTSPIHKNPIRKDDRFMPHINVISKTASLKRELKSSRTPHCLQATKSVVSPLTQLDDEHVRNITTTSARRSASSGSEEFEKLKSKFETRDDLSLLGKMYTSVPDIRELKNIPGYLSGAWIAHKFPLPTDNARLLAAPELSPPGRQIVRKGSVTCSESRHYAFLPHLLQSGKPRSHSSSPPRQLNYQKPHDKCSNSAEGFLRQFYTTAGVVLEGYKDDSDRSKRNRCLSDRRLEAQALWRKIQSMTGKAGAATEDQIDKPTVTFQEPHVTLLSPPLKGAQPSPPPPPPPLPSSLSVITVNGSDSPRRYIESDVNIHYKTPIRFEYKDPIPDDELAYRQAEHMRRVYQEERHRKYIHELEDMQSRRHMDTILPSQKSPIPLNRYDDFAADLSPKPHTNQQPKTIARALYNFQGQSVRELSFRKGDIIYLRRQIDKNWFEGEHNATVGLLPSNYIEILNRDNVYMKSVSKKTVREGKARAKFNFTAQTAVELSLLKGELVTLTRRVDDNWFEGKIGNKKGIFPVSYVEILTDIDGEESYDIEPVSRPHSALGVTTHQSHALTTQHGNSHSNGRISPGVVRETKTIQKTEVLHVDTSNEPISYRALYNYKPQNTDELELLEGDLVYVLEKCDDGWYVGTSARTGCFGTFPGNYVNKM